MIGYVLLAIAIGLGTVILVYSAYGYGFNTKTGVVIQNGLLFIDSKPGGADIYLNGHAQGATTSARLVLPAGSYDLKLTKSGYRDWERKFTLNEHSISRYIYPFLFPVKPVSTSLKIYPGNPGLLSVSPDRHWLLVQSSVAGSPVLSFDQYDTSSLNSPAVSLTIPAGQLTNATQPGGSYKAIEWASDNNHLLLRHDFQGGSEFIILDRQNPANSVNVNKLFGVSPTTVALHNKKIDQLYIYEQAAATLRIGNTASASLEPPLLKHVLAFKPYGSNLLIYVTDFNTPAGQVSARIYSGGKDYLLYSFTPAAKYLIDTAQFQGHSYFVAGSSSDQRINLYKDPLSDLQDPSVAKAIPFLTLRENGATDVSFSAIARFISVEAGQNFAVYDLETQSYYRYSLSVSLAGPLHWMDGHRLIGASGGSVFVMDYDATNRQTLVPTISPDGGFFDRDYNHLFTLEPVSGSVSVDLQSVDMRAGVDLPKQ